MTRGGARLAASFTSPLHDERTAALLGVALGVAFTVCFATGGLSHLLQQPGGWAAWPTEPLWLYRVTQGLHVAAGLAAVPLLLAKLWTVYPHFWTFPPVRGLVHGLERLSLLPLVGGSLFMLVTGVQNITRWYAWSFNFTATHYAVAWITMGGLALHIGVKLHVTRGRAGPERSGRRRLGRPGVGPEPARFPRCRGCGRGGGDHGHGRPDAPAVAGDLRPGAP